MNSSSKENGVNQVKHVAYPDRNALEHQNLDFNFQVRWSELSSC